MVESDQGAVAFAEPKPREYHSKDFDYTEHCLECDMWLKELDLTEISTVVESAKT